jgi:hypothetical protein
MTFEEGNSRFRWSSPAIMRSALASALWWISSPEWFSPSLVVPDVNTMAFPPRSLRRGAPGFDLLEDSRPELVAAQAPIFFHQSQFVFIRFGAAALLHALFKCQTAGGRVAWEFFS